MLASTILVSALVNVWKMEVLYPIETKTHQLVLISVIRNVDPNINVYDICGVGLDNA